jgi:hypothetical protein
LVVTGTGRRFPELESKRGPIAHPTIVNTNPRLVAEAHDLIHQGIAASSRRSYATGKRAYVRFTRAHGVDEPLPCTGELLCLWVTDLAKRVAFKTVRNYLRGLRHHHVERGHDIKPFGDLLLKELLRGARRKYGDRQRPRSLPITNLLLDKIRNQNNPATNGHDHNSRMRMAAMAVAVNGLFRIGELTQSPQERQRYPRMKDLMIHEDHITIYLPRSKTDQFGNGVHVRVSNAAAIIDLMSYLNHCPPTARVPNGPLFVWSSGDILTRRALLSFTNRALKNIGIDLTKSFGISYRRGGATSLAMAGVPDRIIKIIGRWKSIVYSRYIDDDEKILIAAGAAC